MRPLGVGLIYLTELDPLFREGNPDLSVLELEPETFWEKTHPGGATDAVAYLPNARALARVAELPQRKLVHSVGFPVGGSASAAGDYVGPLIDVVRALESPWLSEHLSFNAMTVGCATEQIGFLLPPRQTRAGVERAAHNIRRLADRLPVPFAFETGVNYLQPRDDELPDGEFWADIAIEGRSGILLDLHNLWVNERNGRQSVSDVVDSLPLERVWEIHLAGGMALGDYYLDAHSDLVSGALLEIAAKVVARLPNLGALIYEVAPGFVAEIGLDAIRAQLPRLNALWQLRPAVSVTVPSVDEPVSRPGDRPDPGDVLDWERVLGTLAIGHETKDAGGTGFGLGDDPGLEVLRTLIGEFRAGRIARALRFTTTAILVELGPRTMRALIDDYCKTCFPDVFTSGEADRFAAYLRGRLSSLRSVPYLAEILEFEHALVRAALYGASSRVVWVVDPVVLLMELYAGRRPAPKRVPRFSMQIVPEG